MDSKIFVLTATLSTAAVAFAGTAHADPATAAQPAGEAVASLDPSTVPSPPPPAPAAAPEPAPAAARAAAPVVQDNPAPLVDAPPPPHLRTMDYTLTAFGILGYGYAGLGTAPGFGARFQKTLVTNVGFKGPKLHDDIGIEGGVDYVHYSWSLAGYPQYTWTYNEISVLAGVVYNVWITDSFALYPKMELAYGFGNASTFNGVVTPSYGGMWFQGAVGAVYKISQLALRGEFGWRAVRLGAGFSF